MLIARIVGVFAHPDDETFMCGGTLALAASKGHEVVLACATRGEMGRRMGKPPIISRESLPLIRQAEMDAACKALGVQALHWLNFRDKTLEMEQQALNEAVLLCIRDSNPDVVLTFHPILGGHPDHCAVGRAVEASVKVIQSSAPNLSLYYVFGNWKSELPEAESQHHKKWVEVNTSSVWAAKQAAFQAHRTQTQGMSFVWRKSRLSQHVQAKEYLYAQVIGNKKSHHRWIQ